jgi:hypothetical protein
MNIYTRKILLFILSLFCLIQPFFGQAVEENQDVRNYLDNMFQTLDKSKVPNGLLSDYAFELITLDRFKGTQTNNNYVDRQAYEMLLRTIRSSAVGAKPFESVDAVLTKQYGLGNTTTVSLSAMAYQYSAIKANALTSNLIRYENGKVYDNYINGVWQNPYESKYVSGFCAHDSIFHGRTFTFKLDGTCWFSNLSYQRIEVDPGVGTYRQISVGGTTSATFTSSGVKVLKLRITLSNGVQLLSHSKIEVVVPSTTRALTEYDFPITTKTGAPFRSISTKAEVFVKTRNGTIRNPLIIVEGFDPRSPGSPRGVTTMKYFMDKINTIQSTMGNNLLTSSYDFVFVDFINGEEWIQSNANALIEVIKWVNDQKHSAGSNASNVVMGLSMGGLISRYALRTMENSNLKHESSHYVSFDTPHLGANVPLGVLYGLHGTMSFLENQSTIGYFVNKNKDAGTYLEMAERLVHCNAARQMLVHYVDFGGYINNTLHNEWQQELAQLGFPQGDSNRDFKIIAVANGSYRDNTRPSSYLHANFSASSDIIDMVLPFISGAAIGVALNDIWAGLLSLVPGKTTIKGRFEIYPGISSGAKITDMELKYTKKFVWLVNVTRTVFSYRKNMPGGVLTYDIFPSSTFNLKEMGGGTDVGDGFSIPIVGSFDYNVSLATKIPFVPVSSALCVGGGTRTLTSSLFTTIPNASDIPFGSNYIFQENKSSDHPAFDSKAMEWLVAQLIYGVVGPKLGVSGSRYSVVNSWGTGITWSTDNSSIATINQNGILSVTGKGVVTIKARINNIDISKKIIVGTPRFILEDVKREPGFFRVKAKCIDTQSGYADFILGNKNIVTYQWGIKKGDSNIEWMSSDSPEILISTLEDNENMTVYLKTIDVNGVESTPIFARITGYDIYDLGINHFIFNSRGDLYSGTGVKLNYNSMNMPIIFRQGSYGEFSSAKWNPVAAIVVNDENMQRGILWNRNGYLRDVFPLEEKDRIISFTNNKTVIFSLMLLNFEGEIIQKTPFTVSYKASFPN